MNETYCKNNVNSMTILTTTVLKLQNNSSMKEHWCLYECIVWEIVKGLVLQEQDTTVIFSVCRHKKAQ